MTTTTSTITKMKQQQQQQQQCRRIKKQSNYMIDILLAIIGKHYNDSLLHHHPVVVDNNNNKNDTDKKNLNHEIYKYNHNDDDNDTDDNDDSDNTDTDDIDIATTSDNRIMKDKKEIIIRFFMNHPLFLQHMLCSIQKTIQGPFQSYYYDDDHHHHKDDEQSQSQQQQQQSFSSLLEFIMIHLYPMDHTNHTNNTNTNTNSLTIYVQEMMDLYHHKELRQLLDYLLVLPYQLQHPLWMIQQEQQEQQNEEQTPPSNKRLRRSSYDNNDNDNHDYETYEQGWQIPFVYCICQIMYDLQVLAITTTGSTTIPTTTTTTTTTTGWNTTIQEFIHLITYDITKYYYDYHDLHHTPFLSNTCLYFLFDIFVTTTTTEKTNNRTTNIFSNITMDQMTIEFSKNQHEVLQSLHDYVYWRPREKHQNGILLLLRNNESSSYDYNNIIKHHDEEYDLFSKYNVASICVHLLFQYLDNHNNYHHHHENDENENIDTNMEKNHDHNHNNNYYEKKCIHEIMNMGLAIYKYCGIYTLECYMKEYHKYYYNNQIQQQQIKQQQQLQYNTNHHHDNHNTKNTMGVGKRKYEGGGILLLEEDKFGTSSSSNKKQQQQEQQSSSSFSFIQFIRTCLYPFEIHIQFLFIIENTYSITNTIPMALHSMEQTFSSLSTISTLTTTTATTCSIITKSDIIQMYEQFFYYLLERNYLFLSYQQEYLQIQKHEHEQQQQQQQADEYEDEDEYEDDEQKYKENTTWNNNRTQTQRLIGNKMFIENYFVPHMGSIAMDVMIRNLLELSKQVQEHYYDTTVNHNNKYNMNERQYIIIHQDEMEYVHWMCHRSCYLLLTRRYSEENGKLLYLQQCNQYYHHNNDHHHQNTNTNITTKYPLLLPPIITNDTTIYEVRDIMKIMYPIPPTLVTPYPLHLLKEYAPDEIAIAATATGTGTATTSHTMYYCIPNISDLWERIQKHKEYQQEQLLQQQQSLERMSTLPTTTQPRKNGPRTSWIQEKVNEVMFMTTTTPSRVTVMTNKDDGPIDEQEDFSNDNNNSATVHINIDDDDDHDDGEENDNDEDDYQNNSNNHDEEQLEVYENDDSNDNDDGIDNQEDEEATEVADEEELLLAGDSTTVQPVHLDTLEEIHEKFYRAAAEAQKKNIKKDGGADNNNNDDDIDDDDDDVNLYTGSTTSGGANSGSASVPTTRSSSVVQLDYQVDDDDDEKVPFQDDVDQEQESSSAQEVDNEMTDGSGEEDEEDSDNDNEAVDDTSTEIEVLEVSSHTSSNSSDEKGQQHGDKQSNIDYEDYTAGSDDGDKSNEEVVDENEEGDNNVDADDDDDDDAAVPESGNEEEYESFDDDGDDDNSDENQEEEDEEEIVEGVHVDDDKEEIEQEKEEQIEEPMMSTNLSALNERPVQSQEEILSGGLVDERQPFVQSSPYEKNTETQASFSLNESSSQLEAGYEAEDSQGHATEEEDERVIYSRSSRFDSVPDVELAAPPPVDESMNLTNPIVDSEVYRSIALYDHGYEGEESQGQTDIEGSYKYIRRVETGYEGGDSQCHSEEEEEVMDSIEVDAIKNITTVDLEANPPSTKKDSNVISTTLVPTNSLSNQPSTLSDMDAADDRTATEPEDFGAESSELDDVVILPDDRIVKTRTIPDTSTPMHHNGSTLLDFATAAQRDEDNRLIALSVGDNISLNVPGDAIGDDTRSHDDSGCCDTEVAVFPTPMSYSRSASIESNDKYEDDDVNMEIIENLSTLQQQQQQEKNNDNDPTLNPVEVSVLLPLPPLVITSVPTVLHDKEIIIQQKIVVPVESMEQITKKDSGIDPSSIQLLKEASTEPMIDIQTETTDEGGTINQLGVSNIVETLLLPTQVLPSVPTVLVPEMVEKKLEFIGNVANDDSGGTNCILKLSEEPSVEQSADVKTDTAAECEPMEQDHTMNIASSSPSESKGDKNEFNMETIEDLSTPIQVQPGAATVADTLVPPHAVPSSPPVLEQDTIEKNIESVETISNDDSGGTDTIMKPLEEPSVEPNVDVKTDTAAECDTVNHEPMEQDDTLNVATSSPIDSHSDSKGEKNEVNVEPSEDLSTPIQVQPGVATVAAAILPPHALPSSSTVLEQDTIEKNLKSVETISNDECGDIDLIMKPLEEPSKELNIDVKTDTAAECDTINYEPMEQDDTMSVAASSTIDSNIESKDDNNEVNVETIEDLSTPIQVQPEVATVAEALLPPHALPNSPTVLEQHTIENNLESVEDVSNDDSGGSDLIMRPSEEPSVEPNVDVEIDKAAECDTINHEPMEQDHTMNVATSSPIDSHSESKDNKNEINMEPIEDLSTPIQVQPGVATVAEAILPPHALPCSPTVLEQDTIEKNIESVENVYNDDSGDTDTIMKPSEEPCMGPNVDVKTDTGAECDTINHEPMEQDHTMSRTSRRNKKPPLPPVSQVSMEEFKQEDVKELEEKSASSRTSSRLSLRRGKHTAKETDEVPSSIIKQAGRKAKSTQKQNVLEESTLTRLPSSRSRKPPLPPGSQVAKEEEFKQEDVEELEEKSSSSRTSSRLSMRRGKTIGTEREEVPSSIIKQSGKLAKSTKKEILLEESTPTRRPSSRSGKPPLPPVSQVTKEVEVDLEDVEELEEKSESSRASNIPSQRRGKRNAMEIEDEVTGKTAKSTKKENVLEKNTSTRRPSSRSGKPPLPPGSEVTKEVEVELKDVEELEEKSASSHASSRLSMRRGKTIGTEREEVPSSIIKQSGRKAKSTEKEILLGESTPTRRPSSRSGKPPLPPVSQVTKEVEVDLDDVEELEEKSASSRASNRSSQQRRKTIAKEIEDEVPSQESTTDEAVVNRPPTRRGRPRKTTTEEQESSRPTSSGRDKSIGEKEYISIARPSTRQGRSTSNSKEEKQGKSIQENAEGETSDTSHRPGSQRKTKEKGQQTKSNVTADAIVSTRAKGKNVPTPPSAGTRNRATRR